MRIAVYTLLNTLLKLCGAGIPQGHLFRLVPKIADAAIQDILAPYISNAQEATIRTNVNASTRKKGKKGGGVGHSSSRTTSTFADEVLSASTSAMLPTAAPTITPLLVPHQQQAETRLAVSLLTTLITMIPPQRVPSELRTKIDRLAVVMNERELMLASVLSPPGYVRASLLPFLVAGREVEPGIEMGIQGVVWPRMPVVRVRDENDVDEDAVEDELEENEEVFESENQKQAFPLPIDTNSLWSSQREEWEKGLRHSTPSFTPTPTAAPTCTTTHTSPPPSAATPQPAVLATTTPPVSGNTNVEHGTLRPTKRLKLTETPNPFLAPSTSEAAMLHSTPSPPNANANAPEPTHSQPTAPQHQPLPSPARTPTEPQPERVSTVKKEKNQQEAEDEDDEMVIPEIDSRSDTDTDTDTDSEEDMDSTDQEEQGQPRK